MADNGLWAKLWFDSLTDLKTGNLNEHQWWFWTRLQVIIKRLGSAGTIQIFPPAYQICGLLHVPNFVTLQQELTSLDLPNVTVTCNDSETLQKTYITVSYSKWTRWQGDYSADRVAKYRSKREGKCNDSHLSSISISSSSIKEVKEECEKPLETIPYQEIISYLNQKINSHFLVTDPVKKHINGRVAEGATLDDFKHVVDVKHEEWSGTQQEIYLRPKTLFTSENFWSYRNQKLGASLLPKQKKLSIAEQNRINGQKALELHKARVAREAQERKDAS